MYMDNLMIWVIKWRFLVVILLFVIGFIVVTFSVSGESVSMKEFRYEIMDDFYKGSTNRDLIYGYSTNNFSVGEFEYYNLSSSNNQYLLADSLIFNYTGYDEFYIYVYNPNGTDLNLLFEDSYIYGDLDSNNTEVIFKHDYLMTEWGNNLPGSALNPSYPNGHINLFYSMNNDLVRGHRLFNGYLESVDKYIYYHNAVQNITIDIDETETNFELFRIQLKNNFGYKYPELDRFTRIWLTNVTYDKYVYIGDYGFYKKGDLNESYEVEDITYYQLWGENQITAYCNFTNEQYDMVFPEDNKIGLSCFDDTYIHFLSHDYKSLDFTPDYWLYEEYTSLHGTGITYLHNHLASNRDLNGFPTFNHNDGYSETGCMLAMNKLSYNQYYKEWFNIEYASPLGQQYRMSHSQIKYLSEKEYYGMFIQNEHGNLTFYRFEQEIYEIDSELNKVDYTQNNPEVKSQADSAKMYKLKGDWGAFDVIRKGINRVLEVMQIAIGGVFSVFKPVLDIIIDALEPILDVISEIQAVKALLNVIDSVIDAVKSGIDSIEILVDDILTEIGDVLTELGVIATLLTIAAIWEAWINAVIANAPLFVTYLIDLIVFLVTYIELFYYSIVMVFDIALTMLQIYLYGVIGITLLRLGFAVDDNRDAGVILHDFVKWFLLPLEITLKAIWKVLITVFEAIPF